MILAQMAKSVLQAKRGQKCPSGYTVRYEWPDSDFATHRRKIFVKKKKIKRIKKK